MFLPVEKIEVIPEGECINLDKAEKTESGKIIM